MADEIKQPLNIARVLPPAPSRKSGQRQRRPRPAKPDPHTRKPGDRDDGEPHHVDDYA